MKKKAITTKRPGSKMASGSMLKGRMASILAGKGKRR